MQSHLLPPWLDAFLITPFRWPNEAHLGLWLGSAILALYCVIIGKCVYELLLKIHGKYYGGIQDNVQRYHKVSMDALHSGNKEAYLAANKLAHEHFGKHFFAKASVSMASLVPVPFALTWLSWRFEGLTLYTIPHTQIQMGYVFVFLVCYIVLRISIGKIFRHMELLYRAS